MSRASVLSAVSLLSCVAAAMVPTLLMMGAAFAFGLAPIGPRDFLLPGGIAIGALVAAVVLVVVEREGQ